MEALLLALHLIVVHGPEGQEVTINVDQISSIRKPRTDSEKHFSEGTHCLIFVTNGHFIGTVETCEKIVEMIEAIE